MIITEIDHINKTDKEWIEIESSNMFQTNRYCGGYDADEMAFCFSYFTEDRSEYWFQFSLADVKQVMLKDINHFEYYSAI